MENEKILTLPEVAGLLRIAEKTVYNLAQRGGVPAFKVGAQWRFSRSAIDGWIEARTATAGVVAVSDMPRSVADRKRRPRKGR